MNVFHDLGQWIASTWHNGNGDGYLFISGIAGFATYITVLGVVWQVYRKHICHVKHCWRIQWKTHGDHILCKKHHPGEEPEAADFLPGGKHHLVPGAMPHPAAAPSHPPPSQAADHGGRAPATSS